jgi:DNA-binding LacI/PurR family transcriptional regulator
MTQHDAGERRRAPVMRDVARLAGVSHQTVSRVLNGSPLVSAEMRKRVEAAVDQLGYRPNASARALASSNTLNIGVVSVGGWQYGPSVLLFSIAEAAREAGYATSLLGLASTDRVTMQGALDHLTRDSVDGVVVIAPVAAAVNAIEGTRTDVPLVMFEPGIHNGTTLVGIDEALGARLATRHLLNLGHKTVHQLSGPDGWLGTEARLRGWRAELAAARRVAHEPVAGDWSSQSGYAAGLAIARDPAVTAVFTANDQMALGLLKALDEAGRSVPGDISVVGFDDIPEAAFYRPALTTVRMDFAGVGRQCVDRLLRLIRGEVLEPAEPVRPELVQRASSAPPRRRRTTAAAT